MGIVEKMEKMEKVTWIVEFETHLGKGAGISSLGRVLDMVLGLGSKVKYGA